MGSCYQSLMQMVEMGKVLNRGNEGFVLWLLSLKLFNISIINFGFHNHSWSFEQSNCLSIFIWIFHASDVRKIMACEKFWIEKLWEFFSQQRRQVSPQGSIHLSRELGIYACYPPGPSPHHICVKRWKHQYPTVNPIQSKAHTFCGTAPQSL